MTELILLRVHFHKRICSIIATNLKVGQRIHSLHWASGVQWQSHINTLAGHQGGSDIQLLGWDQSKAAEKKYCVTYGKTIYSTHILANSTGTEEGKLTK